MKIQRINILLIILFFFTFNSCDNELKVAADWKEVPVVFGLLDPSADYNFIRINRAFLNQEGDAISYAGVSDSIQFEELTVRIVEKKNGLETNTITLEKVNGDTIGLAKEPGVFASTPNILYRTDYDIKATNLYDTYVYDLIIVNEKSGHIYRSSTESVGAMYLETPRLNRDKPTITISDQLDRYIYFDFQEGFNAAMYDLVVRFRYKEYPISNPANVSYDSLDWIVFSGKETYGRNGRNSQVVTILGVGFYEFIQKRIPVNKDVKREAIDMDFSFYGGGEDIFTYIQVNKPSIGIVQKKPEFSNIENGIGVFSSVHVNRFKNILLSPEMKSRLTLSPLTESLNFVTQ